MKEILDKITSYNIFNFLFPGVLFAVFTSRFTSYNFIQEDVLIGAFVYYFIGAVISRIGSLVVEPALKKTKVISFSPYEDFVHASKDDPKLGAVRDKQYVSDDMCASAVYCGCFFLRPSGKIF